MPAGTTQTALVPFVAGASGSDAESVAKSEVALGRPNWQVRGKEEVTPAGRGGLFVSCHIPGKMPLIIRDKSEQGTTPCH